MSLYFCETYSTLPEKLRDFAKFAVDPNCAPYGIKTRPGRGIFASGPPVFSFSDVTLSIDLFLCHGIRLLCNDKCHGKIARAYGHSYQMVRKELPATALSLCIAYQSLMGMRSIFIFLAARLSAPSSKQYSPAIPVPRWNPAMKDVREIPPPSSFSRFASCNRVSRSGRCKYSLISL